MFMCQFRLTFSFKANFLKYQNIVYVSLVQPTLIKFSFCSSLLILNGTLFTQLFILRYNNLHIKTNEPVDLHDGKLWWGLDQDHSDLCCGTEDI